KFCGIKREDDIAFANIILPEYIGFVFAKKSKRYVTPEKAAELKEKLDSRILSVGVFVNENPKKIAELLNNKVIDLAQLHGNEDEEYIRELRNFTSNSIIKAFNVTGDNEVKSALKSTADFIMLDSPLAGSGKRFNWNLIKNITRPYFLAGGLNPENVFGAVQTLKPYAVDVSSGIETDGVKDFEKMKRFAAVRKLKGI
ncbi:MAG: phosphoribosylanthranilate isomerase, partial [Acutalibacteraceae bacterium]|nr:phosphoribosylanthranilate isomerase [Acutalibacteraceae bacterium]